jgi:signal transduction histidine kinase
MISVRSVNDLQKYLGQTLLFSFFIVALLSVVMLCVLNFQHEKDSEKWASQRLKNIITIYQSNLSEKLGILANSTIFIDFLRSGKTSRKNLLPDLRYELSNAHLNNVKSMSIINKNNEILFHYGQKTPYHITVSLCYLSRSLNNLGECNFYWTLYFAKDEVIAGLQNLQTDLQICEHCNHINFFEQKKLGSFLIQDASVLPLAVKIKNDSRNFIYLYGSVIIVFLVIFVIWNRYRIKSIFNQYITYPLEDIVTQLQEENSPQAKKHRLNSRLLKKEYIDEINYLAKEIKEYQQHKVEIELGKNLAQVAHDMRSPLLAVDSFFCLVEKKLAESERVFGRRAIRRLDDIVWSLLYKYKNKNENLDRNGSNYVFLHSCIQELLSEKRMEYAKQNIEFEFTVNPNDIFSLVYLSSVNLKRVLSNLINNAVNAILPKSGAVEVCLEANIAGSLISIKDNGRGMSPELLKAILTNAKFEKTKANLGLPHAIKFLEQINGQLDITSIEKKGTTLDISLPPCETPAWCLKEYQERVALPRERFRDVPVPEIDSPTREAKGPGRPGPP